MCSRQYLAALVMVIAPVTIAQTDIYRWDNGQVIPGTEGITPGLGVDLSGWNTDSHNLWYADSSTLQTPFAIRGLLERNRARRTCAVGISDERDWFPH